MFDGAKSERFLEGVPGSFVILEKIKIYRIFKKICTYWKNRRKISRIQLLNCIIAILNKVYSKVEIIGRLTFISNQTKIQHCNIFTVLQYLYLTPNFYMT